jgi:sporulation protein YlmC with PRC-barrel domain
VRLSELLGLEVVDADGEVVGTVHDVVLVQDGPVLGSWGAALRLEALLVGTGSLGTRLGVRRPHVNRPWIVAVWFARRKRYVVPWEEVVERDEAGVTLRCRREDLKDIVDPEHEPV